MSESNRKKIKLLGFEPVQKAIVTSLATLSRTRSTQYSIITSDDIFESDILLIDVHDQVVIENWQQLKDIVGDLPVIAIGEQTVAGATTWVKRSQLATKLLDAMDSVLVEGEQPSTQPGNVAPEAVSTTAPESAAANDSSVPSAGEPQAKPGVFMVAPASQPQKPDLASVAPQANDTTPSPDAGTGPAAGATLAAIPDGATGSQDSSNQQNKTKEALDGELRSAIKQIREGSLAGGVGAIVDNDQPESPAGGASGPLSFDKAAEGQKPQGLSSDQATPALNTPANFTRRTDQAPQTQGQPIDGSTWPKSIVSEENKKHNNRFLIVDDSPYVWTQLRICLESYDVDLDFVSAAEDGLEEVRKRDYDLVFMDVMLPKMNGYDACKRIKKNRASKHIPVIMLTGRSAPANKLKGVLSGCNYYLTKPVSEAEVKAVVDRFFIKVLKKSA